MSDPTSQAPVLRVTSDVVWLPVWKDKDAVPIMNKAKALPIKPYWRPYAVTHYYAKFYRSEFPHAEIRDYNDTVNSGTWHGWTAGEAWVSAFEAEPVDTTAYGQRWKCNMSIRCLRGKWEVQVPNAGYYYMASGVPMEFEEAVPIGKLDSSGGKLSHASDLQILSFKCNREADFSTLGF